MIVVEISLPAFDKIYDFKLNEDVEVKIIIEEIVSIIAQKEQCEQSNQIDNYMLFKTSEDKILSSSLTLFENGIRTGDRLLLL